MLHFELNKDHIPMALKHIWKIRDGQPAFEEFVYQSQRWVNCFVITANYVIVAITLNAITAEAGACWYEAEWAFFMASRFASIHCLSRLQPHYLCWVRMCCGSRVLVCCATPCHEHLLVIPYSVLMYCLDDEDTASHPWHHWRQKKENYHQP